MPSTGSARCARRSRPRTPTRPTTSAPPAPARATASCSTVPGTILLTTHLPEFLESAALVGLGPGTSTIDGQDAWTLLRLDTGGSGQTFRLERLTLTNGAGAGSGPAPQRRRAYRAGPRRRLLELDGELRGGAIVGAPAPIFVLERVWLTGNTVTGDTGGGAIFADGGTLRLLASTVEGNTTTHATAAGGGLFVLGGVAAEIRDSTISGNSTLGMGGGFYFNGTAVAGDLEIQVTRSTITQNHANTDASNGFQRGGGLAIGGGVSTSANLHLVNSIVAENTDASPSGAAPDLALFGITSATSLGFNIVGDNSTVEFEFPAGLPNANGDGVGTSAAPLDPQLEPLAIAGGTDAGARADGRLAERRHRQGELSRRGARSARVRARGDGRAHLRRARCPQQPGGRRLRRRRGRDRPARRARRAGDPARRLRVRRRCSSGISTCPEPTAAAPGCRCSSGGHLAELPDANGVWAGPTGAAASGRALPESAAATRSNGQETYPFDAIPTRRRC